MLLDAEPGESDLRPWKGAIPIIDEAEIKDSASIFFVLPPMMPEIALTYCFSLGCHNKTNQPTNHRLVDTHFLKVLGDGSPSQGL